MSKPAFFAFAGKELMRPEMKPFTIGVAANFLLFAAIPTSGERPLASLSVSALVSSGHIDHSLRPYAFLVGAKEESKKQNPHFHPGAH